MATTRYKLRCGPAEKEDGIKGSSLGSYVHEDELRINEFSGRHSPPR